MKIIAVPLEEILKDFFFRFTSDSESDRLRLSIQASGIRAPVFVQKTQRGYRLLSGFHRYRIALELGFESIPAWPMPDEMPVENAFHDVLLEHMVHRSLNLIEKARILGILDRLGLSWESMREHFLPLLELPPKTEILKDVKDLLTLSPDIQAYIEKYDLSLKQAVQFGRFSPEDQDFFGSLALELDIRGVELLSILAAFQDIAGREGLSVTQISEKLGCPKIMMDSQRTRQQRIARIRAELERRQYPKLYAWNESLENLKKEMELPEQVRLSWDRSLESPGICITLDIRSIEALREALRHLTKQQNQKRIEDMLSVV